MCYRITIYSDVLDRWITVGPVFTNLDQAVKFMNTFDTPLKRVVQVDGKTNTNHEDEKPIEGMTDGEKLHLEELGIDPKHLAFARRLVQSGRLSK